MSWHPAARLLTAAVVVALGVACAPGELATPTPEAAAELIRAAFPEAQVTVRDVQRSGDDAQVPAQFDDADVIFHLRATEDAWQLGTIEQGDRTYTVDDLRSIAATVEIMRVLSDALAAYHESNGAFPALDDLVGLRDLVPDFYPAEGALEDSWGNGFRYRVQGEDYNLSSDGPDGMANTPDDIVLVTGSFAA